MGIPKFFRWISERYPKIIQRHGVRPRDDLCREHFDGRNVPFDPNYDAATTSAALLSLYQKEEQRSSSVDDNKKKNDEERVDIPLHERHLVTPDPISECGLAPPIDRLYIDMNGILHGCAHNNNNNDDLDVDEALGPAAPPGSRQIITHEQIFQNVGYYLDRIVKDVAKPQELLYLAIDGVAPRAKLNQQRSRRYRSGKEGEIEQTVYDAHMAAVVVQQQEERDAIIVQEQQEEESTNVVVNPAEVQDHQEEEVFLGSSVDYEDEVEDYADEDYDYYEDDDWTRSSSSNVQEIQPGRYTGKFESSSASTPWYQSSGSNVSSDNDDSSTFHSNAITPGTVFFQDCTTFLQEFLKDKLTNDPDWQHLTVILSGPNVPGEGEHKIMDFLRRQRHNNSSETTYNPNLRHCIMGQDGDLLLLGLVTHEPNLVLLRERILFDKRRHLAQSLASRLENPLDLYIHNPNFDWLHMNVLRDYLALELECLGEDDYNLERSIDDFVFLTFLVGNDFLPHMPALDIADEAFDLLFYTYRQLRDSKWVKNDPNNPYLTDSGTIVSGERLEQFFQAIGSHETNYIGYKKRTTDWDLMRHYDDGNVIPSEEALASKESADRKAYREMLEQQQQQSADEKSSSGDFVPVMSSRRIDEQQQQAIEIAERLGGFLQQQSHAAAAGGGIIDDQDVKGRYYADKFGWTPFDEDSHVALRKAYLEGLLWNLEYYYKGCTSWEWYYPYHYGPMMSDLVNLEQLLKEIQPFDENRLGKPLEPFQQLLACMPPSHANLLPEPYQALFDGESSPIADFYPLSFTIDMNGKRWPWEAVVLLPFIDSQRLVTAVQETVDTSRLSEQEIQRNATAPALVFQKGKEGDEKVLPLQDSHWALSETPNTQSFPSQLPDGVQTPLPGFPTLRDGTITSLWRKRIAINVHGNKSRYNTAVLEFASGLPDTLIPLDQLGQTLIGTTVYINYPHLIPALVTAVSNEEQIIRGKDQTTTSWSSTQRADRQHLLEFVVSRYVVGEKLVGSGGMALEPGVTTMEETQVLLHVRPLQGLEPYQDDQIVQRYCNYEVHVPLFCTAWAPVNPDPRLQGVPALLEKDPYQAAKTMRPIDMPPRTAHFFDNNNKSSPPQQQRQSRRRRQQQWNRHSSVNGSGSSGTMAPKWDRANQARRKGRNYHTTTLQVHPPWWLTVAATSSTPRQHPLNPTGASTVLIQQPPVVVPIRRARRIPTPAARLRGPGLLLAAAAAASMLSIVTAAAASGWGLEQRQQQQHRMAHDNNNNKRFLDDLLETQTALAPARSGKAPPLEFAHGTTTVSFIYQHGIVVAVDSRASLGSFVGSKTVQKVLPISEHCLATMAGGAADCSVWIRKIKAEAAYFEATRGRGRRMSLAQISRLLANALYANRGLGISIGTMIMGFDDDDDDSDPKIYYVDDSGMRLAGDLFAVGSGSTFALSILDGARSQFANMTTDEAVELGIRAIRHATFRDGSSGGFINVYVIAREQEGCWKHVFAQDVARIQEKERRQAGYQTE